MEQKIAMTRQATRMCRSWRRRPMSWKEAFPHARIVNDPKKLAHLNAESEKRKQGGPASQPTSPTSDGEGMQKNNVEPWMEICELAAKEEDPKKLMELTSELIRLLEDKKKRSSGVESSNP